MLYVYVVVIDLILFLQVTRNLFLLFFYPLEVTLLCVIRLSITFIDDDDDNIRTNNSCRCHFFSHIQYINSRKDLIRYCCIHFLGFIHVYVIYEKSFIDIWKKTSNFQPFFPLQKKRYSQENKNLEDHTVLYEKKPFSLLVLTFFFIFNFFFYFEWAKQIWFFFVCFFVTINIML